MKSFRATASSLIFSSHFDEETRTFLQGRLRLMSGVLGTLLWVLIGLFLVSTVAGGRQRLVEALVDFSTRFPNAILFWMAVVVTLVYGTVRMQRLGSGWLALLDGILLQVLILPCLVLYALLHTFSFSGFPYVVPFLILFPPGPCDPGAEHAPANAVSLPSRLRWVSC